MFGVWEYSHQDPCKLYMSMKAKLNLVFGLKVKRVEVAHTVNFQFA